MASRNLTIDMPIKLPASGLPLGKGKTRLLGGSRCSIQKRLCGRDDAVGERGSVGDYFLCLTPASLTGPRVSRAALDSRACRGDLSRETKLRTSGTAQFRHHPSLRELPSYQGTMAQQTSWAAPLGWKAPSQLAIDNCNFV